MKHFQLPGSTNPTCSAGMNATLKGYENAATKRSGLKAPYF